MITMTNKIKSPKYPIIFLCIITGVIIFSLTIIIKFPYKKLNQAIIAYTIKATNGSVDVKKIEISFFGKVLLEDVSFKSKLSKKMSNLLQSRRIEMHLRWLDLLQGKATFKFKASVLEDYLTGSISLNKFFNISKKSNNLLSVMATGTKLSLKDFPIPTPFSEINFTSNISTSLNMTTLLNDFTQCNGDISIEATNGKINIPNLLNISSAKLIADLVATNGEVKIKKFNLKSKELNIEASGKIKLLQDIPSSQLDIKLNLKINQEISSSLNGISPLIKGLINNDESSLMIMGTISNPKINFS
ncbi:MAG: type II secretion system protein GspN [bacterium]